MSIHDSLSQPQIDKIVAVIKRQCDKAARKEIEEMNRVTQELYGRLKKGRKAHDVTGDVYIGFSYPENKIAGLDLSIVENGFYSQPELQNEHVIIHIYHGSNKLQSKLVKDCAAQRKIEYICIRYGTDKYYRLEYVEAVYLKHDGTIADREDIYRTVKIKTIAV